MKSMVLKKNKKGFTLVELVIVIAVLAILAAIAIPTVSNVISTANTNVDKSNAQTIELALKTADAEITAGTVSGITKDNTISEVLAKYGLTISTTAAGKSGATFQYLNKKVVLSSDNVSGAHTFTPDTSLNDFVTDIQHK